MYCSVSLVSTSLAAKKKTEEALLILWISSVDTANKVCCAYIKHQSDLYAQCVLYPVYKNGSSFEEWLQQDMCFYRMDYKQEKNCK